MQPIHNPEGADGTLTIDRDFLAKIIPDDGVYVVFELDNQTGDKRQTFHADLDEMVSKIAKVALRGWDVYHGCASFKTDQSREAANARSMKALFVDLDCGEAKARDGKGYLDKERATAALKAFCEDVGLPRPLIVDSGGGIHAYWPFTSAVPVPAWKPVAQRLKALCQARGLLADPLVTADAARILRPVGSYNCKYGTPQLVQMVRDAGPRCFSELQGIIDRAPLPRRGADTRPARQSPSLVTKTATTVAEQVNPHGYDLTAVEEALRRLDPDCGRKEWASIGMAIADAFGGDGRELFDRWSRGDLQGDA